MAPAKKAPAKKAPAKKVAARKAAPRRVPQTPDEKLAAIYDKRPEAAVFEYGPLYGETWTLVRPMLNSFLSADRGAESNVFGSVVDSLAMFIHPDERDEFISAVAADENFDFDALEFLRDEFAEVVYDDVPLGASEA